MSHIRILRRIRLGPDHRRTGRTRHVVDGRLAPFPSELRIVQYEGSSGYYLFHCDESGNTFTDTHHETIEEAIDQAGWEFHIQAEKWECLGETQETIQ